ncbi:MAG: efflux RND transporter permease subunit, partial [Brevundimonas sp.]
MLTLGALTISIGRVVDDSIVVIENIKRHLAYGEDKKTAITTAVREVATAVTAATLTTVAVFLPVALVGGMAGELFRPFALTVTIALLASLLVSLTIVPVLAYWFLGQSQPGAADSAVDRDAARARAEAKERNSWLQRGYAPVLRGTQRHPVITLLASVAILAGTVAMVPLVPTNLLGGTGQNTFSATQSLPAGSSLETTLKAAKPVEKALREVPGVQDVQMTVGTPSGSFASFLAGGSDTASFTVTTDAKADQQAIMDSARGAVEPLAKDSVITISGAEGVMGTSDVTVQVGAPTPELLTEATTATAKAMAGIPGATGVSDNLSEARPQVSVTVDRV